LTNAQRSGLPVSFLEEKILEGRAKGIVGSKICKALADMVEEMYFSKHLFFQKTGEVPQKAALRIMYEIHAQGLPRKKTEEFVSFYADKKVSTILEGLRLYALLDQAGVPSAKFNEFIALAMQDEAILMRWKEISQLYSIVIKNGGEPEDFMNKAIKAVKSGRSPHSFARELSLQPRSLGVLEQSTNDN
jgi:hypothetical protein